MFLHLGDDIAVPIREIVAIIGLESMNAKDDNQAFIDRIKQNYSVLVNEHEPKSMILVNKDKKNTLYFSPISSLTLQKRLAEWVKGQNRSFS